MYIGIIAMALWYDPKLTMQFLESKGATQFVFTNWFSNLKEFKTDFELRRITFGLSSLLRMNLQELPQVSLIDFFYYLSLSSATYQT